MATIDNQWIKNPEKHFHRDQLFFYHSDWYLLHSDWQIQMTGHTDARVSDEYNLKLSKRRVDAAVLPHQSGYGSQTTYQRILW